MNTARWLAISAIAAVLTGAPVSDVAAQTTTTPTTAPIPNTLGAPETAPAAPPVAAPGTLPIDRIRTAADPSLTIDAYTRALVEQPHNPELEKAYVHRMVDLNAPEMADAQARDVVARDQSDGVAQAVTGYMAAKHGQSGDAARKLAVAVRLAPSDPFVMRTAAQIVAWYDALRDRPSVDRHDAQAIWSLRVAGLHSEVYADAYRTAIELQRDRQAESPAATAATAAAAATNPAPATSTAVPSSPTLTNMTPSDGGSPYEGVAMAAPTYVYNYPDPYAYYAYPYPYPYYPWGWWGGGIILSDFVFVHHDHDHHDHHDHDGHHDVHHDVHHDAHHDVHHDAQFHHDASFDHRGGFNNVARVDNGGHVGGIRRLDNGTRFDGVRHFDFRGGQVGRSDGGSPIFRQSSPSFRSMPSASPQMMNHGFTGMAARFSGGGGHIAGGSYFAGGGAGHFGGGGHGGGGGGGHR